MRIPRVFISGSLPTSGGITLPEEASHYLCKVLRMTQGRELLLFNNTGFEYSAIITRADKKAAELNITETAEISRESPLKTHLAIGISRGERMDWVIQKATELGVSEITPLFLERCEVKLQGERLIKKQEHWQQVAISACEQCQRNLVPNVHPASDLNRFCTTDTSELKLILHHKSKGSLLDIPKPSSVAIVIGPEGGLTDLELELAAQCQFRPLALGPRVLRTETAPLTALTTAQLLWGDLT